MWVEWDTLNTIIAMTPGLTPRIKVNLSRNTELSIFDEFVVETSGFDLGQADLVSNRIGLLFSWNFRPKSWIYIALNDYRVVNECGNLEPENQIGAIKVNYLLYF
ncbi:hypothetical protein KAT73_06300 [candidate division WOR-3 bacterium]|nr:hypothetical protein [candidate division WOR-3 bacterium]